MAEWNIADMIANVLTGGNIQKMKNTQQAFEQQGSGVIPAAQGAQMEVQTPGTLGPMGGPIQTADTIGHGVPRASLGRGEDFMRLLKRGLGGQAPSLPEAGARQQMFADFPRPEYDPTQRRY